MDHRTGKPNPHHCALNIQTLNNTLIGDTAHGGGGGQRAVAYGRSWFVRLQYQFSKPTQ